MRKIYIDLGAYDGDTIQQFFLWNKDSEEYQIYAFEPNPRFEKNLKDLVSKYPNLTYEQKAAWTHDGRFNLKIDNSETPMGSSLMQSKKIKNSSFLEVETFDFSAWLLQFKDDYVVIKMDIEGAEFPILEKMFADGTINIPKTFYVEFHPNKVREFTSIAKERLIERLKALPIGFKEWH